MRIPQLHTDHHGLAGHFFGQLEDGEYVRLTIEDGGPLDGRDLLLQKRADGAANCFLMPGEATRKSFAFPPLALTKDFSSALPKLQAAEASAKAANPPPPPSVPTWTNANKPTHIQPVKRVDGRTTYLPLHGAPAPKSGAYKIGDPAAVADGSVMGRNGALLPMTPQERSLNRSRAVSGPADLPSLKVGWSDREASQHPQPHPDFDALRVSQEFADPEKRTARLNQILEEDGFVRSTLPEGYSTGPAYMMMGPDGHVFHVASAAGPWGQSRPELRHGGDNPYYAYGDHTRKEVNAPSNRNHYPSRAHADEFLAHAIANPAWVTVRKRADGREIMYRHVDPRVPGEKPEKTNIGRSMPAGVTYMAERVHHPDDPNGSHWNLFNAIPWQPKYEFPPDRRDEASMITHRMVDKLRGNPVGVAPHDAADPDGRPRFNRDGGVGYTYINRNAPEGAR